MDLTWEILKKYDICWNDIDLLGLTWSEIESMTFEEIVQIASQRIDRFKQSSRPEKIESQELQVQIENLYASIRNISPEIVPQKEKFLTHVLENTCGALLCFAFTQAFEHREEIIAVIFQMMKVITQILSQQ